LPETIEYEQFDGAGQSNGDAAVDVDLSRLSDIPMELSVEIGRTHMTVGETLDLRVGSVVTLERLAGEAADLLVNGSAIARGEVVVIDEQYGLRITEILDGQTHSELTESPGPDSPLAPAAAGTAGGTAGASAGTPGADPPAGVAIGGDGPIAETVDGGESAADGDAAPDQEG
jgi:flagellar motor switch protein FliN